MNFDLFDNFNSACPHLNDFELIHRGKSFKFNTFLLSTLSNKVRLLSKQNIHSYEIPCIPGPIDEFIQLLYGSSVELNLNNSLYFNFWAEDLEIPYLINETNSFIDGSFSCDHLIDFTTLLIENKLNFTKFLNIIISKIDQIVSQYYPLESLPTLLLRELFNSPKFNIRKHIDAIRQIIRDHHMKQDDLITDQTFDVNLLLENIDLNACRIQLIALAFDVIQKESNE